jgi:adenylate cyclase class IV
MPPAARNVEVKVAVSDLASIRAAVEAMGGRPRGVVWQTDTYFLPRVAGARLKLREQRPGAAELIAYLRPDRPGLRQSAYRRSRIRDPDGLAAALGLALGVGARVRKQRRLYLLGRTRVHLDRVAALGPFLELEVVLRPGESPATGRRAAAPIPRRLGLATAPQMAGSYADLVLDTARAPA